MTCITGLDVFPGSLEERTHPGGTVGRGAA